MWIREIELTNFRNYKKQKIKLKPNINIFYGDNAQGKTNIIESIYYSSIGKTFRTNKEKEIIMDGENFCNVKINYEKIDREGKVEIFLNNKKNILINGVKIKKISQLLGNINVVIFNPEDINILKGGPQNRRRFLDIMISQLKPNYINMLNLYVQTLEQRNTYLKQIREENKSQDMLDIWDEKLVEYGSIIAKYRSEYVKKIKNKIDGIHREITNGKEFIEIEYITDCEYKNIFIKKLKERRTVDITKGFTTKGIHRDDFNMKINDKEILVYGSQGQHRTAILTLKLAELNIVFDEIGEYPILLLDDFMSELDEKRRNSFLEKVKDIQVIITCTDRIKLANNKNIIYNVNNGNVINEETNKEDFE